MGSIEQSQPKKYSTSFAFFEAIWEAGITHVFVNLGSDHPSIIEAMVQGKQSRKGAFPRIITCPNEMVALSMADGFARLTNKPQCVIVHVDVGTQGLAAAVHNASCGRAPVLIFAGLSPYTIEGEYRGSRTEYIHWIQDVPDQKQIIAQYCRYTGEIKAGRNVKQMVNRALQFATSDPQGPVYLYGAREPMEEDIEPYYLDQSVWNPVVSPALPVPAVEQISDLLVSAKAPLLLVGYTGRNPASVPAATALADLIPSLRVLDTGGCDMCFPADHPASLGFRYGQHEAIPSADVILVIDCDVPWIPTQCKPSPEAKIVHVDIDPLKQQMPVFYIPAMARYRADSTTTFVQLVEHIKAHPTYSQALSSDERHTSARSAREAEYAKRMHEIKSLGTPPDSHSSEHLPITPSLLGAQIRSAVPANTIYAFEAVTLGPVIGDQLLTCLPKSWINCGGGGLGWSGGAALGIKLASDYLATHALGIDALDPRSGNSSNVKPSPQDTKPNAGAFVCQIVGDGTFLFSVPSSVYWISNRYDIPILTIVLNNKGWNAPRKSLLLVHPHGAASKVDNKELNISFEPTPDFAGIAKASTGGRSWAGCVDGVAELIAKLGEAVKFVREEGRSAVLEVRLGTEKAAGKEEVTDGAEKGDVGLSSG